MPNDWEFNYELSEVWHSMFWLNFAQWWPKKWFF